jgi:hypothetical protein
MKSTMEPAEVESRTLSDFARVLQRREVLPAQTRLNLDQNDLKNGLGQLVLTLMKLLHELLERQGIRRIEAGSLTDDQIERLGLTLMKQAQEIDRLRQEFGLEEEDLNLNLGPLGQLL